MQHSKSLEISILYTSPNIFVRYVIFIILFESFFTLFRLNYIFREFVIYGEKTRENVYNEIAKLEISVSMLHIVSHLLFHSSISLIYSVEPTFHINLQFTKKKAPYESHIVKWIPCILLGIFLHVAHYIIFVVSFHFSIPSIHPVETAFRVNL